MRAPLRRGGASKTPKQRVNDRQALGGYLDAGIVQQGVQGTSQGGPLSPLLANVLLDEVDKEVERRGPCLRRLCG